MLSSSAAKKWPGCPTKDSLVSDRVDPITALHWVQLIFDTTEKPAGECMNQFVIDMTASQPGLRHGYPISSESRSPAGGRVGPVRPAWPFLVNASARGEKQGQQDAAAPSGFAS